MTSRFSILTFLTAVCILLTACGGDEAGSTSEVLLNQSFDAAMTGDWKTALDHAESAYLKEKNDTNVILMYALALERNDRTDEALEQVLRASRDKTSFQAQYTLGRLYMERGDYEMALEPLQAAYAIRKDDPNTIILLERATTRTDGNSMLYHIALKDKFPKLYGPKSNNPFAYNGIGLCAVTAGRKAPTTSAAKAEYLRAAALFEYAKQMDPDAPEIYLNLAVTQDFLLKKRAAAAENYRKFLKLAQGMSTMERQYREVSRRLNEIRQ